MQFAIARTVSTLLFAFMNTYVYYESVDEHFIIYVDLQQRLWPNMPSKGQKCQGPRGRTGVSCDLSRSAPGQAILIKGPCKRCHERRCRTHCQCGRDKTAAGRKAGRPSRFAVAPPRTAAPPRALAAAPPPAPVGRPATALACEAFADGVPWDRLLAEVEGETSSVLVAALAYDHPGLQAALLARLCAGVAVVVLVDKAFFLGGTCKRQKPSLSRLALAGAEVRLCRGYARNGCFHQKALILSGRVAWIGSANWTSASSQNRELVTRLTGPPVLVCVAATARAKEAGELWKG